MSDQSPQMPLDENDKSLQVSFHDTEGTQTLDGSSAHAESTVIHATELSVIRLVPHEFGSAWYKRGADPVAATDDGVYFNGELTFPVDAGDKVSVVGAKVNLSVLKREQS